MKIELLKKFKKDKVFKKELQRAHFMIALLAVGIAMLSIINASGFTGFSYILTSSLVILSAIIAVISLFVVFRLSNK